MAISQKKKEAIANAIRWAAIRSLDEHFPEWQQTPPEDMDAHQRKIFDAVADVERLATQKVAHLLT